MPPTHAQHMVNRARHPGAGGSGNVANLKHNDEGQADGQKIPVGRRILPIISPESLVPAGDPEVSAGSWGALSFPASGRLGLAYLRAPEGGSVPKQGPLTRSSAFSAPLPCSLNWAPQWQMSYCPGDVLIRHKSVLEWLASPSSTRCKCAIPGGRQRAVRTCACPARLSPTKSPLLPIGHLAVLRQRLVLAIRCGIPFCDINLHAALHGKHYQGQLCRVKKISNVKQ